MNLNPCTYKGTWSGPRWMKFTSFLKDVCHCRDVELILDVDKGWITEQGWYSIKGDEDDIDWIIATIETHVREYEKERA